MDKGIRRWVVGCAVYLKQCAALSSYRSSQKENAKRAARRLDRVSDLLAKAEREVIQMLGDETLGQYDLSSFDFPPLIYKLWEGLMGARVACDQARRAGNTSAADLSTSRMRLQRSAVNLAYATCKPGDSRAARGIAKKIMQDAGIDEPSEESMTNWLKELREADRRNGI